MKSTKSQLLGATLCFFLFTANAQTFITTWQSSDGEITIPTNPAFTYDYTISIENLTSGGIFGEANQIGDYTTTVTPEEIYRVEISGTFPAIFFNGRDGADEILTIEQWGDIAWLSMQEAFENCINLTYNAVDAPDLTNVTSLSQMFRDAVLFNGAIGNWDVSTITDMSGMFYDARAFNQPLNTWNVSNVTDMSGMFRTQSTADNTIFNQPLDSWVVSNVTNFSSMFYSNNAFDQDISMWDISSATNIRNMFGFSGFNNGGQPLNWGTKTSLIRNMDGVFWQNTVFNQPIEDWDVSAVTTMSQMFQGAESFDQPLNGWVVSSVTNMSGMFGSFTRSSIFNQPLNNWDVSNVTDFSGMFHSNAFFDQNLSSWIPLSATNMAEMFQDASAFNNGSQPLSWGTNTANVTNMSRIFDEALSFDQPINDWDVSSVIDFSFAFRRSNSFNQPLDNWNVSLVENFSSMFINNEVFNQDLSSWDVRSAIDMSSMFQLAVAFDQNLGAWDISGVNDVTSMLDESSMSVANYDNTLIGWASQTLQPGLTLGANGLFYSTAAIPARDNLIATYSWNIVGDQQEPTITVLSPNGGEVLNQALSTTIFWEDPALAAEDDIEINLIFDDGENTPEVTNIASGVKSDFNGSFDWTVPLDQLGDFYFIEVSSPTLAISDLSDNAFIISDQRPFVTPADSAGLIQIYNALDGENWSTNINWIGSPSSEWDRITVDQLGNVRSINLQDVGAKGDLVAFTGIATGAFLSLEALDLSVNSISGLIDFSTIQSLTFLDVSDNSLLFEDLAPLVSLGILNLTYSPQASIRFEPDEAFPDGIARTITHLNDYRLSVSVPDLTSAIAWFRNSEGISQGEDYNIGGGAVNILSIDFDNMGEFTASISSSSVPGLVIDVDPQEVLAVADISMQIVDGNNALLESNVSGYLLEVSEGGSYDSLENGILENVGSAFVFEDIVLGNYLCAIDPTDRASFIQTYVGDTIFWEAAETILLRSDTTLEVTMRDALEELTEEDGEGSLSVFIEENFGDETGRIEARRAAKRRKCGLRRRVRSGRTGQDDGEFDLIAYGETDDFGNFQFGFLPEGKYRFFVEYPGIPLDPNAEVEFTVGEAGIDDKDFRLSAFVTDEGIEVTIDAVLGVIMDYFKDLEIYPNPSREYLNIKYRHLKSENVTVQLVDLAGNLKWSQNLVNEFDNELRIEVSDYAEGIYILRFYDRESPSENVVSYRVIVRD